MVISRGDGELEVLGLSIYETDGDMTRIMTLAVFWFLVADAVVILWGYWREKGVSYRLKNTLFWVFLITATTSIPVLFVSRIGYHISFVED